MRNDGFKGQRSIILPRQVIEECKLHPVIGNLYITDIGEYPSARDHYRERKGGCKQFILIYCTTGRGWVTFKGRRSIIKENDFFVLPPNKEHAYGADDSEPWSILWLHFSGSQSNYFNDIAGKVNKISISESTRVEDRKTLFEEIFQNLDMGYSRENLEYANMSLWHFLASFKFINQFRQVRRIRTKDPVEKSIMFMKDHITTQLTLRDLAQQAGLSPTHFSVLFKQRTRRSPMDYFINLKIQWACHLLDTSKMRIKEIAEHLAFRDPYYFSRLFTKIMGISPRAYRQLEKG